MKRAVLPLTVSIMLCSVLFVTPIRTDDSNYFTFVRAYWGTGEQTEVSPGDVETLTVILQMSTYESVSPIGSVTAELSLPDGFKAAGGGDKATTYYSGEISLGSEVRLEFLIFISPDAAKGSYTADLELEYYIGQFNPREETIEITFDVTGKPKIDVEAPNDGIHEGNQQIYLTLSNEGDAAADNLKIIRVDSTSASVELKGETSLGNLEPGDSISVPLRLFVPADMRGKILPLTVEVSYIGPGNMFYQLSETTLQLLVGVEEVKITTKFPGKSAAPGDTVQFQVTLENSLGVEKRFKISLDSIPPNWEASIKSVTGETVTEVILGGDESVDLVVEVESPEAAEIGEEYGLSVKVETYDGNVLESLPLHVVLEKAEEEVKITAKFKEVTVEAGKVVQYPITIRNLGGVNRSLLLSVEPPADWKAVFKSDVLEVSTLYIETGESENLIIEVTPPSTVNIGSYTIPVQVRSETGVVYTETELKATIIGSYALGLEPSTLLTSVTTGGSTTFSAEITNAGHTSVTVVSLDVETPEGLESSITPTQVELLKPRESLTFNVLVKASEDTVAGDYLITLTALSDQVESDSVQVRVTVTAPTSWGMIGVGVAVVIVIALLFVFMKFKRR